MVISMTYDKFSRSEFERILRHGMDPDFVPHRDIMSADNLSEYVYSATISNGFEIVIFSSISVHTEKARAKGNDAIRTQLHHQSVPGRVGDEKKTLRTENWAKNLQQKIRNASERANSAIRCENCGKYLIRKDGTNGEFFGCIGFPKCDNNKNIS